MDFGESVFKSAKRELEEETDLTLEEMELITINNNISGTAHYLTLGFKVLKYKGDVKVMEPDEIVIWKWFSLDKLPERIYFPTERIIHFYKEKKFIDLKEI